MFAANALKQCPVCIAGESCQVLAQVPFGLRRLRQRLEGEGWRATEILRRRFPVDPPELQRDLRRAGEGGSRAVSLLCTRVGDRPVVFICDPR